MLLQILLQCRFVVIVEVFVVVVVVVLVVDVGEVVVAVVVHLTPPWVASGTWWLLVTIEQNLNIKDAHTGGNAVILIVGWW